MDVKDIGKKIENVELVEAMHAVRENENKDTLKQLFESVVHAVFIVPAKLDQFFLFFLFFFFFFFFCHSLMRMERLHSRTE